MFSLSTKHIHFSQPVSPCDPESFSLPLSPSLSLFLPFAKHTLSCPCAHLLSSFPSFSLLLPLPLSLSLHNLSLHFLFHSIRIHFFFSLFCIQPHFLTHSLTNIHILLFLFVFSHSLLPVTRCWNIHHWIRNSTTIITNNRSDHRPQ